MSEYQDQLKGEFRDEEYRYSYAEDFLNTWIATQIVTLREQREWNQAQLGELIGTKQPGISRLENVNHSNWKVDTLKRLARALGVRLNISFETFGTLIEQDEKFGREYLKRPKFEDDQAFAPKATQISIEVSSADLSSVRSASDAIAVEAGVGSLADNTFPEQRVVVPFRPRVRTLTTISTAESRVDSVTSVAVASMQ